MLLFQRFRDERKCSGSIRKEKTKAELRLQKDLSELISERFVANSDTRITFPDSDNIRLFECSIIPREGIYSGALFRFKFNVPTNYPFNPPKVSCLTQVLHPAINWRTGKLFLPLLSRDWKPTLSINTVVFSLQLMFLEPSFDETSSHLECYALVQSISAGDFAARTKFDHMVMETLEGGWFFGTKWERNIIDDDELSRGITVERSGGSKRSRSYGNGDQEAFFEEGLEEELASTAFDDDVSDLASQVESLSTEESPVKRRMKDFHPF